MPENGNSSGPLGSSLYEIYVTAIDENTNQFTYNFTIGPIGSVQLLAQNLILPEDDNTTQQPIDLTSYGNQIYFNFANGIDGETIDELNITAGGTAITGPAVITIYPAEPVTWLEQMVVVSIYYYKVVVTVQNQNSQC